MRRASLVLALLLAVPALGQDEEPPDSFEVEEEARPSRFVAAGWCPVLRGEEEPAEQAAEGEGGEEGEQEANAEEELACDAGMGVDLYGRTFASGRLSLVGVLGVKSLGAGVAWTVRDWFGSARVSVAVGLVAPYSEAGIDADRHAVALGVTLGFAGRASR